MADVQNVRSLWGPLGTRHTELEILADHSRLPYLLSIVVIVVVVVVVAVVVAVVVEVAVVVDVVVVVQVDELAVRTAWTRNSTT